MIKRCPECNRTYSDESISFCLADGALLSPPYDTTREEAPPTEILPAEERPVVPAESRPVPPTEPPKPAVPTITSLAGGQNYAPFEVNKPEPKRRGSSPLIWAALAFVIVGAIVIGIFGVRRVLNRSTEPVPASSPEVLSENASSPIGNSENPQSISTPPPSRSSANQTEVKNTSSPQTEAKTSTPATLEADPVLFPPDSRRTPETKQTPARDYNQVFSQGEVDTKAQILEKPKPSYTDAGRQNNIQGTVALRVVLSANGSVGSVSPVRGLSHGLTEQAIAAAKRIKFVPAKKDGRAVSVAVTVEYNFSVY